jgi:hypothetical protein
VDGAAADAGKYAHITDKPSGYQIACFMTGTQRISIKAGTVGGIPDAKCWKT